MAHTEDRNESKQGHYWRSLDELADSPEFNEKLHREFPQGAAELEMLPGTDRRRFLGVLGASMGLAGLTMTGCIRKPREYILPYAMRPEDLIEGKPQQYASAIYSVSGVLGILVTSFDGRPTKIEGNPLHPMSLGATNVWTQANVLELYDPDRSKMPRSQGKETTWAVWNEFAGSIAKEALVSGGEGLALLVDSLPSPTFRGLVDEFKKSYPKARVFRYDPAFPENSAAALAQAGAASSRLNYSLNRADVLVALDSDFLGTEGDIVRNSKQFASRRRVVDTNSNMSRLYAIEPAFSITGMKADNRLTLRSTEVGEFALALAAELSAKGVKVPDALVAKARSLGVEGKAYAKWVSLVAADLLANRGKSLVLVGDKQPAWVHSIALALNDVLGNLGSTVSVSNDEGGYDAASISELAKAADAGQIKTLLMVGGNPVYTAPSDLNFTGMLAKVANSVHLSFHIDETSKVSTWHLPRSHNLEAWGDLRANDGTVAIVQPLIDPLFASLSEIEFLAHLVGNSLPTRGFELVQNNWKKTSGNAATFDKTWRKWLHDGVVNVPNVATNAVLSWATVANSVSAAQAAPAASTDNLEVRFAYCGKVFDGRYGNNAWLQELPDTVSKVTWDNAALVSPKTAKALGLENEEMVDVNYKGRKLALPVWITPGIAENTVVLPLGYGRNFGGKVADGAGFNTYELRTSEAPFFDVGAKLSKTGKKYKIATTQEHGSMENRPIVRESTLAGFKQDPIFARKLELIATSKQKTLLWTKPNQVTGQQWGMSIDLSSCTGCNACTVACQAENNISVVGKERVIQSREMHWIRIDRYFTGSVDDPQAVTQPMMCQHCETAPCEQVCPVGATVHSPEGLNDIAYNRCIGTRYCANNCPYKVRRFNYFNFAKENDESNPLFAMQKNPNVTVRFRGVIEKCTYCVHRINDAKIEAHNAGSGAVKDGRIVTACQQVCPTDAISFGDVNNPDSQVSRQKAQPRNYALLGELATQPRTTYLAQLRNPNPELV